MDRVRGYGLDIAACYPAKLQAWTLKTKDLKADICCLDLLLSARKYVQLLVSSFNMKTVGNAWKSPAAVIHH